MRYIILVLIIVICKSSYTQPQIADLVITLNVTLDDTSYHRLVEIGLDSTATDSIDNHLGEFNLPPIPPPGYVAFLILPYNNFSEQIVTHKDFRFGELPYTGVKEYRLRIMSNYGATISWNLPDGATGLMQDLFGGIIFNIPISGIGSIYISNLASVVGRFKIVIDYVNVVPVELTSFTASVLQNEKEVQLEWITSTETNNSGFEIQRTSPLPSPYQGEGGEAGRGWGNIGFVPGFGTTTETKSYSLIDENVTIGTYKYRLKQIDFDGSFEYSNEIEVEVDFTPKEFVLYQNYPNPFNPTTTIKYEIPGNVILSPAVGGINSAKNLVTLKVFDVLGNEIATIVNEEKQAGTYEIEFNAADLPSGIYFYQLKAGNFIETKKMILMK